MDYAKHRYDQQRKTREIKKKQSITKVKEIRLSPTIEKHDINVKVKTAERILSKGDKIKVSIRFRGRMITHIDVGRVVMNDFIEALGDKIIVEAKPKMDGYLLVAVIAPATEVK